MSAEKIITIARGELGYTEGKTAGRWSNDQKYSKEVPGLEWSNRQPWCVVFVIWCALQAGLLRLFPLTASCDVAGKWFKDRGRWSQYPAVGAMAFFGSATDLSHTGLVIAYDADTITTIEGNTNQDGGREGYAVIRHTRKRRASNVIGYGYPDYPGGIVSADPAWAHAAPAKALPATHVSKGRDLLLQGLAELAKAKPSRTRAHRLRKLIAALVAKLPVR